MTRHAIFIEPTGALKARIDELKGQVRAILPGSPYCDHPAHSSLFVAPLKDPAAGASHLPASLAIAPLTIYVGEPIVFYDDAFTAGHTLAWRARSDSALQALQRTVAQLLAPFVDPQALPPLPPSIAREPFLSSYQRFGFPFVGDHWIPHFTIASLRTARTHPMITAFLAHPESFELPVAEISLWLVAGETHTKLRTIKLEGPP
ncbi:MAG: 2'-5' RNA ligase family protein [Kiritimatiellia bacterium]